MSENEPTDKDGLKRVVELLESKDPNEVKYAGTLLRANLREHDIKHAFVRGTTLKQEGLADAKRCLMDLTNGKGEEIVDLIIDNILAARKESKHYHDLYVVAMERTQYLLERARLDAELARSQVVDTLELGWPEEARREF